MNTNLKEDVVIVGAGPVGLLLGCWLRKLGIGVRVLEKRLTRSTKSKAASMNAYSLANLYALGIDDQFAAIGKKVYDLNLYWQGKRIMRVNYRQLASKYNHSLCLAQPTTEALLEANFLASGGRLERGIEVINLSQTGFDQVKLYIRHAENSKDELITAQYVIGCDGGKSIVRQQLGFAFDGMDHGTGFIMIDVTISWSGDVDCVHYFVSDGAFLILIPLSEGKHRIVIRTPENEKKQVLGDKLSGYQELVRQYGPADLIIDTVIWESNTVYYNRLAKHYRQGRILLAGDAAHLFSSIGGLGMNTGFQDALALAWRLAGILKKRFSETVLDSYESERRALTQSLITITNEMTDLITQVNQNSDALREWMPIMSNRKRLATLPLHFSGLGQRYETGLLVKNSKLPVGQLVPYFEFNYNHKQSNSYDLIDGHYFYIVYNNSDLLDKSSLSQYNKIVKLIQIENSNDWQQICSCLNLQTEEAIFIRPDGIVAEITSVKDIKDALLPILKAINYVEPDMQPLLVFDLDGTLADTSHDLITALNKVLIDNLEPIVENNAVQHLISKGADGLLGGGFGSAYTKMTDNKKQELIKAFVTYYEQGVLNEVALYPNVKEVLNTLSEQGFKMAICSNKNTELVENILEHLQIRQHFRAVCGGDFFVGIKKPDYRHVEGTMRVAGFDTTDRNAIFIGDAMSDMTAAKNTGIPSVFVTYGYADVAPDDSGANAIVHQASQLPEAISSLLSNLSEN